MPVPERQYLASQGCGGWNAARQPAGLDAAKGAADLLRWLGCRVSGAIARSGDQGGRAPPTRHPLLLARLQQMGDQVAQASPFKVRPLRAAASVPARRRPVHRFQVADPSGRGSHTSVISRNHRESGCRGSAAYVLQVAALAKPSTVVQALERWLAWASPAAALTDRRGRSTDPRSAPSGGGWHRPWGH